MPLEDLRARMLKMEESLANKHLENTTRLVRVETIVKEIDERLFGNGQEGIVQSNERRITKLEALAIKIGVIAGGLIILIEVMHELPIKAMLGWK